MGDLANKFGTAPQAQPGMVLKGGTMSIGTGGMNRSLNFVNPQAEQQLRQQEIDLEAEKTRVSEENKRMGVTDSQMIMMSASIYRLVNELKNDISESGTNVVTAPLDNPAMAMKIQNLSRLLIKITSGSAYSDKEREALQRMVPRAWDVISSFVSGRNAKAVMVNKLAQFAADAKSLPTAMGGDAPRRFDAALKQQMDTINTLRMDEYGNEVDPVDQRIKELEMKLQMRKGQ